MNSHPVSVGDRADTAELRQELLSRLGVRADANEQDIEAAHNGLVEFLELAPHEVKSWAATQTADVDEAFALLSGPEADLLAAAPSAARAQVNLGKTSPAFSPAPAAATPSAPASSLLSMLHQPKVLGAIGAALVVAVVFAVFQMGKASDVPGISGKATGGQTQAAGPKTTPVDPAKVSALMAKIGANPKDKVALQTLGDLYFAAADYKNSSAWEKKVIGVDPKNQVALLSLGAAQFNLGNAPEAKKTWLAAAKLYPKNAEVHYDLGFLYMSQTPPDKANMQAEWKKVVDIDPNSNLAKTVATHIKSSNSTPSAAPSAK